MRRGLGLALVSASSFGLSGSLAACLLRTGWTPGAIVLVRVALAAVVLALPAVAQQRRRGPLPRGAVGRILGFGLLAVGCAQLCYFSAVRHLSVGIALMLEYSGLLLVVAVEAATRRRPPSRRTTAGSLVALAGLALALQVWAADRIDGVGVLWGLGAAVGLAGYFLFAARELDSAAPLLTAAGGLAAGATALGIAGLTGVLSLHVSGRDVSLAGAQLPWPVPLLALAMVTGALAYATGVVAAQRLGATLASFVGLAEVLVAIVAAWGLLGQRLGLVQLAGGALVVGGIVLVRLDSASAASVTEPDELVAAA